MEEERFDVAICMPYFERLAELKAGLESFARHGYFDGSYPYSVSLSIVDDGSTREPITSSMIDDYTTSNFVTWLLKKEIWDNPCVPLNWAVKNARAEWVLLQSPETIHRVDLITPMMERATAKDVSVLCPVVSRDAAGKQIWRCHPSRPDRLWFCQLINRDFYLEAGGCDERFRGGGGSDDRALQIRLERHGVKWEFLADEYFAYHLKHGKPYRYQCESNRQKLAKLYGVPPHVMHNADLTPEEISRLGLKP